MAIMFPEPGSVLGGRYVLESLLGAGQTATVHLAAQPALARTVAIKVMSPADGPLLAREAVAAARVRHASSVIVHEAAAMHRVPYLVMDHVRGPSLSQLVDEGSLPVSRALAIMDQLLSAIEAAHEAQVVHGDIRSANVLVEDRGGTDHVVLIDYGSATFDDERPRTGVASDIRAAGLVLRELVTGADLPPALSYALSRAVELDPQKRFPTAEAMRRSLKTVSPRQLYQRSSIIPLDATARSAS